jgi:ABC-type antimicrobial peptide transport system permease subunit
MVSHKQVPDGVAADPMLVLRTSNEPSSHVGAIGAIASTAHPSIVVDSIVTLERRLYESLATERAYAVLLGAFGGLGLLVSVVGLFGILSYAVAQRTPEIAIRVSVGAAPGDIVRLIVTHGLIVVGLGICGGLAIMIAVRRFLERFLYGITADDAATVIIVVLLVSLASIAACVVPARRASRINPLSALRSQ